MFDFTQLSTEIPGFTYEAVDINGTPCALVDREHLEMTARVLKEKYGFTQFIDTAGIDRFTRTMRFEVTYNLRDLKTNDRIFLKVRCDERDPHIPSVVSIWDGAGWHEREVYDMYGIIFDGHPDLRRMYMPEEYEYYPLRKDFPLMGIPGSIPIPKDEHLPTTIRLN
ncbi:MAG TPA: NADH-quinone oxidoreductase subunit C [Candidatus Kapabacteria bacterium]|nr:NADH-quinone oxidoreductase subunit C [Candidatus Kapabacteria bacterium]